MSSGLATLRLMPAKQETIVSDIHGTLSDFTHRLKFVKAGEKPDWDQFNRELGADLPVAGTINTLRLATQLKWAVVLVTGTPERYHSLIVAWLRRHRVPYNALFMRKDGDFRSDVDVKRDMYEKYLKGHNVQLVLEDRDKLVEFWRSLGLNCLQVRKGEY